MLPRLFFLVLFLSFSGVSMATVESALMPGEVIQGHAKLEDTCTECHVRFDKEGQVRLCSDCHKDVKSDVLKRAGYHGRIEEKECNVCHTDHKGRNAKIVVMDTEKFDHFKTDFPLVDAHNKPKKIKCKDCHDAKKKYRDAPLQCNGCHRKDDKHKGSLGPDCKNCHNERNWKETRFDHSLEKTRYALIGKHADVKCSKCHVSMSLYNGVSHECVACHREDDTHKGQYGKKCESCHTEKDWMKIDFDHDIDTKYKLLGKHVTTKCEACHKTDVESRSEKIATTCIGCHKKDDKHKDNFGAKCEACHVEKIWKTITFDHTRDTKYPLKGKHGPVKCIACHTGHLYKLKLPLDCLSCHKKDDVHKDKLGKRCESCHTEKEWKTKIDHGRTRFPLLGTHIKVDCKKCHQTQLYVDTPLACYSCHKKDDDKTHKRRLGKKCETCHNARSWKAWDYDHGKRTKFKLDGGHKKPDCYACHEEVVDTNFVIVRTCVGCHENDDVHQGKFGQLCERCHVVSDFKTIPMGSALPKK